MTQVTLRALQKPEKGAAEKISVQKTAGNSQDRYRCDMATGNWQPDYYVYVNRQKNPNVGSVWFRAEMQEQQASLTHYARKATRSHTPLSPSSIMTITT